jgi:peptidoglycan/LPS O-acetylase OafA/YrhL
MSLRQEVAHFWSLALEERFYLIWPLLALLLRARYSAIRCAAVIRF